MSQTTDRSFYGLILSLIFHASVLFLVWKLPPIPINISSPTTVEYIEREQGKTVVPSHSTPEQEVFDRLKKQADYLSATTKRVKEEMLAPARGKNVNSRNNNAPFNPIEAAKRGRRAEAGDTLPGSNTSGESGQAARTYSMGPSSSTMSIPGVRVGNLTFLNTDQFTFFAFYDRMSQQVINRWTAQVRDFVSSLSYEELQHLSVIDRVVKVEFMLTPAGEFVRAIVHSSSGSLVLDQAPGDSFRAAAPFLNPPKEMVKEDGFIHLFGQFTLVFRAP